MIISVGVDAAVPAETAIPATPTLQPRILWPGLDRAGSARQEDWRPADSDTFPDPISVRERYRRGEAASHLPMFAEHARGALRRLLIVDSYLLSAGRVAEDHVLSWFPDAFEATDVRLMCSGLKPDRQTRQFSAKLADAEAAINARKARAGGSATRIRLKITHDPGFYPFVHDRFAVVDDELWHFGATVGGLHPGVNAATRGWNADEKRAVSFFGEIWSQPAARAVGAGTARGRRSR